MATTENLKEAFAGESQANRKYLAFAKKAEEEDLHEVAKLFRAAAEAETVHAHNHFRVLDGAKDTRSNLKEAIGGEGYEFQKMYPVFLEEAERENENRAATSFRYALAVEEIHYELYGAALKAVEKGADLPRRKIFVCRNCGNTVYDEAPDRCPVCSVPEDWFVEIV